MARLAAIFFALTIAVGLVVFARSDLSTSTVLHVAFIVTALAFLGSLVTLMTQKAHDSLRARRSDSALRSLIDDDRRQTR